MILTAWSKRKAFNVALITVFSGLAFVYAEAVCMILKLSGKPYVLSLHGGNLPEFSERFPSRTERLLGPAAKVIAPSSYLIEYLRKYRDDLMLVPNPVDISRHSAKIRHGAKPRIIWLRAFHHIYNPTLAPKVVKALLENGLGVHLTMVGPDKEDGSLEATKRVVSRLRIQDKVDIIGGIRKAEVPAFLEANDIFINTTNIDNTPISVIEAMASGLCIVSTNVGGIPFLLEDGIDAVLVKPDNPGAMAVAIRRILVEPGLSERLSINARNKAERFSWDYVLPLWEDLFEKIIAH
jgi:glycosyltransferase involved in cell wall biosynthesis